MMPACDRVSSLSSCRWCSSPAATDRRSRRERRGLQPRPAQGARHHGIHKIKHVVVIMQENRSFDSYFGTFPARTACPTTATATSRPACPTRARRLRPPVPRLEPGERRRAAQRRLGSRGHRRRPDGRLRPDRGAAGRARLRRDRPICASNAPPDVMGYHDAREIPNYWRWAHDFTLQDHMFEPTASWSLPGASVHGLRLVGALHSRRRPDELRERRRARRIQDRRRSPASRAPTARPRTRAAALRAVTRCLERHGVRRQPYGLDLREPHLPDALALCRHLAPPARGHAAHPSTATTPGPTSPG